MTDKTPASKGLPLTVKWDPAPKGGKTLFVALAYHGADRDLPQSRISRLVESPARRGHRIVHRDFYANARSFDYQLAMVQTARASIGDTHTFDIVVDASVSQADKDKISSLGFNEIKEQDLSLNAQKTDRSFGNANAYTNIILVYADALGLGCAQLEKQALKTGNPVFVINGRRRAFSLTRQLNRRLSVSRMLANTRIVERILSIAIVAVAFCLAKTDQARKAIG